jgi:hypothetical protein
VYIRVSCIRETVSFEFIECNLTAEGTAAIEANPREETVFHTQTLTNSNKKGTIDSVESGVTLYFFPQNIILTRVD